MPVVDYLLGKHAINLNNHRPLEYFTIVYNQSGTFSRPETKSELSLTSLERRHRGIRKQLKSSFLKIIRQRICPEFMSVRPSVSKWTVEWTIAVSANPE